jgi:hypothetical protein
MELFIAGMVISLVAWVVSCRHTIRFIRQVCEAPETIHDTMLPIGCAVFQLLVVYVLIWVWLQPTAVSETGPLAFVSVLLYPGIAPLELMKTWFSFEDFIRVPLVGSGVAFAISAMLLHNNLRGYAQWAWPTFALLTATATFVLIAEIRFHQKLASAAAKLAPDCLDTGSILNAIAIAGAEYQFNLHAAARKGHDLYAWSFRHGDFYKVPDDAKRNVGVPRGPIANFQSCHGFKSKTIP